MLSVLGEVLELCFDCDCINDDDDNDLHLPILITNERINIKAMWNGILMRCWWIHTVKWMSDAKRYNVFCIVKLWLETFMRISIYDT